MTLWIHNCIQSHHAHLISHAAFVGCKTWPPRLPGESTATMPPRLWESIERPDWQREQMQRLEFGRHERLQAFKAWSAEQEETQRWKTWEEEWAKWEWREAHWTWSEWAGHSGEWYWREATWWKSEEPTAPATKAATTVPWDEDADEATLTEEACDRRSRSYFEPWGA